MLCGGGEASAGFRGDIQRSPFKVRRRAEHLYDDEVAAREAFLLAYGQMLPPDFSGKFLPSLFQKPPKFRLERIGTPPDLPDLDLEFQAAPPSGGAAEPGAPFRSDEDTSAVTSEGRENRASTAATEGDAYGKAPELVRLRQKATS